MLPLMCQAERLAALSLCLVLACREAPTVAPARPAASISDASHSAGNPHFHFLPPLVPQPSFTGTFDGTFAPVVRICAWDGSRCVLPLVAEFTTAAGPGSETVRLDPLGELYVVNWKSGDFQLDPTQTYRISVLVGRTELGFADVDVVSSRRELRNVQAGEYVGLVDGLTLPIKFRIERRAMCGSDAACVEAAVGAAGGTVGTDRAGVAIPSGAVDHDIHLAVRRRDPQPCLPLTVLQAGGCYEVLTDQAAGFTLQVPATVGICADAAEPGAALQLGKVEPDDPAQEVVLLDVATADFLQCGAAPSAGGLTRSFSYVAPTMNGAWFAQSSTPRVRAVATALQGVQLHHLYLDDRDATAVLITGGFDALGNPSSSAELVSINSNVGPLVSIPVGDLITARWGHTAVRLAGGRVLVAGGLGPDPTCAMADAEIYDPTTRTFVPTGGMNVARTRHTATRLLDGRVLIAGGITGCAVSPPAIASAEIYDPATGQFTLTAPMLNLRERHTATLLPDGRVWVAGGDGGAVSGNPTAQPVALASTELFIPTTGGGYFTQATALRYPRYRHSATYLPISSGRAGSPAVLVAGGTTGTVVHNIGEVACMDGNISPVCTQVIPLAVGVEDHVARLSGGSNVLIVGGATDPAGTASRATQWVRDGYPLQTFAPPAMATARDGHTAMHIYGNRLLVVGGFSGSMIATTREVFSFQ